MCCSSGRSGRDISISGSCPCGPLLTRVWPPIWRSCGFCGRRPPGDWLATPRAAELHDHVRRRQWSETGVAGVESPVTMAQLQEALDADTALLSFVWSEGRVVCLVVTANSAQVIEHPRVARGPVRARGSALRPRHVGVGARRSARRRRAAVAPRSTADSLGHASRTCGLGGRHQTLPHHRAGRAERDPVGDAARAERQAVHDRGVGHAVGGSPRGGAYRGAGDPLDSPSAPESIAAAKRSPAARRRGRRPPSWTASGPRPSR